MALLKITGQDGELIPIPCTAGQRLSQALWLSAQLPPLPLCNGLGRCGCCRARFLHNAPDPAPEDKKFFSEAELAQGWRLACRHIVPDCAEIEIELPQTRVPAHKPVSIESGQRLVLGIDLGTTSIQWAAVSPEEPENQLASGSESNPQAGAGADVISRLAYAATPEGLSKLAWLATRALGAIVLNLNKTGITIARAAIAANSAMTEILLAKDISGLGRAPYKLSFSGNETLPLVLPGLDEPLPTLFPPLPGPFTGGDISAGLLYILSLDSPLPFVLIDLGTNAEMALFTQDKRLFLASAPLGPALEGIGPACGQAAGPGVITKFTLAPAGLKPVFYQDTAVKGISASGYLSLLAILLKLGLMDSAGQFKKEGYPAPLARKFQFSANRMELPHNLYLLSEDVEELLKVKAAFSLTLQRLLEIAELETRQLATIWLAGALGEHGSPEDLATLGFLPGQLIGRVRNAGNAALKGACLLAAKPQKNEELARLCKTAHVLQMGDDPSFANNYFSAMRWGSNAT